MDKSLLAGSTTLLVLKLLEDGDKYGYQMVEELRHRSDKTFELKSGTLYPRLHTLEQKGDIEAWVEDPAAPRPRRYYHLTDNGRRQLAEKETEWRTYAGAMLRVLEGGEGYA